MILGISKYCDSAVFSEGVVTFCTSEKLAHIIQDMR